MIFKIIVAAGVLIAGLRIYSQIKKTRKRNFLLKWRRFQNIFGFDPPKPRFNIKEPVHQVIKYDIEEDLKNLADILLEKRSGIDRLTDAIKEKVSLGNDYIQYLEAELEIEIDQNSELEAEINEKRLLCIFFKIPIKKDIWDYSWDKIIKKVPSRQNIPINNPNSPDQ